MVRHCSAEVRPNAVGKLHCGEGTAGRDLDPYARIAENTFELQLEKIRDQKLQRREPAEKGRYTFTTLKHFEVCVVSYDWPEMPCVRFQCWSTRAKQAKSLRRSREPRCVSYFRVISSSFGRCRSRSSSECAPGDRCRRYTSDPEV